MAGVRQVLRALEAGTLVRTPQDESAASYYPMLDKELGRMDFSRPARELHNQVRGLYPWPGAFAETPSGVLKIWSARAHAEDSGLAPGTVARADAKGGLFVACGEGTLEILELQAPGSKRMNARDYLRGKPMRQGAPLGERE